eukprot:GHVT01010069.1.p1 GENE.GHVT01010069.1~~GHVT01010069.1.p1  ORF type:complete len:403 (+),score=96.57 GHVT01010069.1:913-2121(+)
MKLWEDNGPGLEAAQMLFSLKPDALAAFAIRAWEADAAAGDAAARRVEGAAGRPKKGAAATAMRKDSPTRGRPRSSRSRSRAPPRSSGDEQSATSPCPGSSCAPSSEAPYAALGDSASPFLSHQSSVPPAQQSNSSSSSAASCASSSSTALPPPSSSSSSSSSIACPPVYNAHTSNESDYRYLLELIDKEQPDPNLRSELCCDVPGVYWDKRSWIASWYESGKRFYKSFSAKTHGFYRSKFWAIKVRLSKVQPAAAMLTAAMASQPPKQIAATAAAFYRGSVFELNTQETNFASNNYASLTSRNGLSADAAGTAAETGPEASSAEANEWNGQPIHTKECTSKPTEGMEQLTAATEEGKRQAPGETTKSLTNKKKNAGQKNAENPPQTINKNTNSHKKGNKKV